MFEGVSSTIDIPLSLFGEGLELTVLKKAEKEDLWIVRIVEIHGRNSKGTLNLKGTVAECNLIEWENLGEPISVENELALDLSPFEIKTYKVRFT